MQNLHDCCYICSDSHDERFLARGIIQKLVRKCRVASQKSCKHMLCVHDVGVHKVYPLLPLEFSQSGLQLLFQEQARCWGYRLSGE